MPYQTQHLAQPPTRADVDGLPGATLLEFGTPWCGFCLAAQPHIEQALQGFDSVAHIKVEDGASIIAAELVQMMERSLDKAMSEYKRLGGLKWSSFMNVTSLFASSHGLCLGGWRQELVRQPELLARRQQLAQAGAHRQGVPPRQPRF